jgi:hypothetical protein
MTEISKAINQIERPVEEPLRDFAVQEANNGGEALERRGWMP